MIISKEVTVLREAQLDLIINTKIDKCIKNMTTLGLIKIKTNITIVLENKGITNQDSPQIKA